MSMKEIALPEGVQIQTFGAPWDNKPILLAPLEDGAVVSAWSSDDTSYLTIVESNGAVRHIGSLEGPDVHGLATIDDKIAVLVRRDDALYAVLMNTDGAVLREQRLIGEVPQEIVGNKWTNAGNEARIASADDRYVVYAGHMQRWPDNIGHQGDLLWLLDDQLNRVDVDKGWDWGCSHSFDVRLAYNGTEIGTLCLGDGFPIGIQYRGVSLDKTVQISGDTLEDTVADRVHLGGLVPYNDGFAVSYTSIGNNGSAEVVLGWIQTDGAQKHVRWITNTPSVDERGPHLARLGDHLLVAWKAGSKYMFAVAETFGGLVAEPVELPLEFAERDDFITISDGRVGYLYSWPKNDVLKLVTFRSCMPNGIATATPKPPTATITATPTSTRTRPPVEIGLPVTLNNMPNQWDVWTHEWVSYDEVAGWPMAIESVADNLAWAVVGNMVYRWDGESWINAELGPLPEGTTLRGIAASADGSSWVVGAWESADRANGYGVMYQWDGTEWSGMRPTVPSLASARSYGFDDVVIDPAGIPLVRAGICWTPPDVTCFQQSQWFRAEDTVWSAVVGLPASGVSAIDFDAMGNGVAVGTAIWTYSSGSWTFADSLPEIGSDTRLRLVDVVTTADGVAWAHSVTGWMLRWDGTTIRSFPRPGTRELRGLQFCGVVEDGVWAAFEGQLWHWSGGSWSTHTVSGVEALNLQACDVHASPGGWALGTSLGRFDTTQILRYRRATGVGREGRS